MNYGILDIISILKLLNKLYVRQDVYCKTCCYKLFITYQI